MNQMMKQIEKAQKDMQKVQEEVGQRTVEATAGGGMVKVVINGNLEVQAVEINPEAVDPDDVEMLQDLVIAAMNEAIKSAQEMMSAEMAKLKIPGLV